MSDAKALFLKRFNPCPDRVEAIEQSIHSSLDERSNLQLMDHIETCKRCRRYRGYLESIEQGFRNLPEDISEISPFAATELPSTLQEEMAQAMKRNLSRWLLETVRGVIYRQKMLIRFFVVEVDLQPLTQARQKTHAIYNTLLNIEGLAKDEKAVIPEVGEFLDMTARVKAFVTQNKIVSGLKTCLALHDNMAPYIYYNQIYILNKNYDRAIEVNTEALNSSTSNDWRGVFENNIGGINHVTGHIDKAIDYYKKALKNNYYPNWPINLAFALLDKGLHKDAFNQISSCLNQIEHVSNFYLRNKYKKLCSDMLIQHFDEYKSKIAANLALKNLILNLKER